MSEAPQDVPIQHVYSHPSPVEHWRHVIESVALIVAACWGFYVFVYQERIKPASQEPELTFAVEIQHAPISANKEFINASLTWKNIGSVDTQIDGYIVNLYGRRYAPAPDHLRLDPYARAMQKPGPFQIPITRLRTMAKRDTLLVTIWHPEHALGGGPRLTLLPADSITHVHTMVVPKGAYDTIYTEWIYCQRKGNDDRVVSARPTHAPDGSFDIVALRDQEQRSPNGGDCGYGYSESPV